MADRRRYILTYKIVHNYNDMQKAAFIIIAMLTLVACSTPEERLRTRAEELCQYIPDHQLKEGSAAYMTSDFYAALDTMFNHMPEFEAMDHEWLYYFVTGNGGTMADYTVKEVRLNDKDHAVATIEVRQQWEDGTFDTLTDIEEHQLSMERVGGRWLMADFDGHKADCLRHIETSRREQAVRDAMGEYLVNEIGQHYLQGKLCVPTLAIVAAEEDDDSTARVWCDCWIDWYTPAGDTLMSVSGGNHAGCMTLRLQPDGTLRVTAFEQTVDGAGNDASARRIFGSHYDIYSNVHSHNIHEALRCQQLREYCRRHNLGYTHYKDYGWDPVPLTE